MDCGITSRRISPTLSNRNVNNLLESIPQLREGERLDSLESIHVYVLSNLLCRPIIVVSEDMLKDVEGRDIAPIPFGGVYLPLERRMEICWKYPLVLAYDFSHFSTLVPAKGDTMLNNEKLSTSIPIVDKLLNLLPLRFAIDPGVTWDLVQDDSLKEQKLELTFYEKLVLFRKYLDVVKVPFKNTNVLTIEARQERSHKRNFSLGKAFDHVSDMFTGQGNNLLLAAKMNTKELPNQYNEMITNYISSSKRRLSEDRLKQRLPADRPADRRTNYISGKQRLVEELSTRKCLTDKCRFIASPKLQNGYCESCNQMRELYGTREFPSNGNIRLKQDNLCNITQNTNIIAASHTNTLVRDNGETENFANIATHTKHVADLISFYSTDTNPNSSESLNSSNTTSLNGRVIPITVAKGTRDSSTNFTNIFDEESQKIQNGSRCLASGCKFYGSREFKGFCSSCYRQFMKNQKQ